MKLIIFVDGGSRGNHDKNITSQGYGSYIIYPEGSLSGLGKIHQRFYGEKTNNEAEYLALISSLEHVTAAFESVAADLKTLTLEIHTDSQLVIGQMSKDWKINKPHLIPLAVKAKALLSSFGQIVFVKEKESFIKEILGH